MQPINEELSNIDFEILFFQGLEYVGATDDYESFYAINDSNFAIYVEKIIYSAQSFEDAIGIFSNKFGGYENFNCNNISSQDWLTKAQILECDYMSTELNTTFKSVIFYKNNEFIHSMLSVWGQGLGEYGDLFNEFNKKAIKWG
jgi:hypothetical protein